MQRIGPLETTINENRQPHVHSKISGHRYLAKSSSQDRSPTGLVSSIFCKKENVRSEADRFLSCRWNYPNICTRVCRKYQVWKSMDPQQAPMVKDVHLYVPLMWRVFMLQTCQRFSINRCATRSSFKFYFILLPKCILSSSSYLGGVLYWRLAIVKKSSSLKYFWNAAWNCCAIWSSLRATSASLSGYKCKCTSELVFLQHYRRSWHLYRGLEGYDWFLLGFQVKSMSAT